MKIGKKTVLTIFYGVLITSVLYAFVLFSASIFISSDNFKDNLFSTIEKETGFKVSCEKAQLKKGFSPYLTIYLFHTGIMYPDNNKFLQVREADLKIKTLPLFFKKIEIKNVNLIRPIINITLYKDFSTSIEKFFYNKEINSMGYNLNKFIPFINAENYKIKFYDESINKTFYIEGSKLNLLDLKFNENMHIIAQGAIFENTKKYIQYDFDVLASLNSAKGHFKFSPFKTLVDTNVSGFISGNLKTDSKNNIHGNLKIQDLSLNLGSVISSNNKINLIFNGKEVDVNALIHTSKEDSAKIRGKLLLGKKRYIDLNTDAKNINLENLFKITGAVSKILNIKNPLNDIEAKGLLNADFNIKSDFIKLQSAGKAEIINALLKHKVFQYPISNINALINFDNNEIKIKNASANINKSPINLEGAVQHDLSLDLKLYSDNLNLNHTVFTFIQNSKSPFDIKNGILNFNTNIKGILGKNLKSHSILTINNLNLFEKNFKIPITAKKCVLNLDTNNLHFNGGINVENADLKYNNKTVKSTKFDFNFDENNLNIPKNIVTIINSPVMIYGNINNFLKEPASKINFEGEISSNDIASFISEFINIPYKAIGKLTTKGSIEYEKQKINIKSQINADKNNYISYLVIKELLNKPTIIKADLEADKNNITIKDISLLKENETQIKLNGQIENIKAPAFKNFNVSIPNEATIASNFLGGEELSLKSNLTINKDIKNPDIKGNMQILQYKLKKYLTSIKNADVSFSPENIRISAPNVMVNNSIMNVTADISPDLRNLTVSNMQINSINLDVNSMFGILTDLKKTKSYININNGSATINNFKLLDLKAHDISSNFKISDKTIKISDINASAYTGTITGRAEYELDTGILDFDMEGKNISIKPSLYDLCKLNDNLSGQTDFKAHASMLTGDYNTVIKSLSGALEFNANRGTMGTLGKFEYYLNAQNILYHGLLNATLNSIVKSVSLGDTTHYNRAYGTIILQNGKLITDNLHTQGDKMSLFIKGRHNIFTNQSVLDIYGRISDEIRNKLGSFMDVSINDMINGHDNKKYNIVMTAPQNIINEIEPLSNKNSVSTNMFKVSVMGNIKALNAINSFNWIVMEPKSEKYIEENKEKEENTTIFPDFSDL